MAETLIVSSQTDLEAIVFKCVRDAFKLFVVAAHKEDGTENKKPIDIKEASKILRLSTSRIYVLAGNGTIPSMKAGGRLMFYERELLAWIQSGKRFSQTEINEQADNALIQK